MTPRARKTDPESSHIAAKVYDDIFNIQQEQVFEALSKHPDVTSHELAKSENLDRYIVARRLPELRSQGRVTNGSIRKCNVTGNKAMTWFCV